MESCCRFAPRREAGGGGGVVAAAAAHKSERPARAMEPHAYSVGQIITGFFSSSSFCLVMHQPPAMACTRPAERAPLLSRRSSPR